MSSLLKTEKAVAEKSSSGFPAYRERFDGTRRFFTCVKPGKEGIHPFQHHSFGSVAFPRFTQRPMAEEVEADEEGEAPEHIATLSSRENGGFYELSYDDLQRCIEKVRTTVVRWQNRDKKGRPHRCALVNLMTHRSEPRNDPYGPVGGRAVPVGYANQVQKDDEPMARYLVLIPEEELGEHGSREAVKKLPSMEALDPSLFQFPPKIPPFVPEKLPQAPPLGVIA